MKTNERYQKAQSLKDKVLSISDNTFVVPSQTNNGKAYVVEYKLECNCKDYEYGNKCKHIIAVQLNQGLI